MRIILILQLNRLIWRMWNEEENKNHLYTGAACSDRETLKKMMLAGMNVARLNFSHGTYEEHQNRIELVKSLRSELKLPVAIMLDTKGPEYRIQTFKNGKVQLKDGDVFALTAEDVEGTQKRVSVSYKKMIDELNAGDRVLLNNGLIILEVEEKTAADLICRVIAGGELSDRKSMSFPNKVLRQEYLSEQDRADLLFGIEMDVRLRRLFLCFPQAGYSGCPCVYAGAWRCGRRPDCKN